MISKILEFLSVFIISIIATLGYPGIILLMAIESACIPLPSEIILPFSGYLAFRGQFSLLGIATAGAIGCNLGSMVAYYAGLWGGRPFLLKYGKYVLISHREIDMADRWFDRFGQWTVFFSRLLPVIRTFIALPAGVARMEFWKFNVYTFLGSWPWCYALAFAGYKLGAHWSELRGYFHRFDYAIGALLLLGVIIYIRMHLQHHTNSHSSHA
jgi:membrane protein DedA with SNARE-associated domain